MEEKRQDWDSHIKNRDRYLEKFCRDLAAAQSLVYATESFMLGFLEALNIV